MSKDNSTPETSEKTAKAEGKPSAKSSSEYGDFLGAYKGFSDTTINVAQQAASVMESEIAAVIKVAKQMEAQSPIVERLRSEKPGELIQRFRRAAHEVVDIWVDIFGVALSSANNAARAVSMRDVAPPAEKTEPEPAVSNQRSIITAPQSAKAGSLAEFPISFENSGNAPTDEFKLYSTDLISDSGERIVSSLVKFMPASLKIAAHQTEKVMVVIALPKETKPGVYTGLVLASNMNQLRSEIILKVE
jgi:hypothetical protein